MTYSGGQLAKRIYSAVPREPSVGHFKLTKTRFYCRQHGIQSVVEVNGSSVRMACGCSRLLATRSRLLV
jgi:hypothetical protein